MHALSGRAGKTAMTPEQVEDIRDRAAAQTLAVIGAFDQKIAEMKAERAKLESAQTIAKTLADAEAVKARADEEAERVMAEAKAKEDAAKERLAGLLSDIASAEAAKSSALLDADVGAKRVLSEAGERAAAMVAEAAAKVAAADARVSEAAAEVIAERKAVDAARAELAALEDRIAKAKAAAAQAFGIAG